MREDHTTNHQIIHAANIERIACVTVEWLSKYT